MTHDPHGPIGRIPSGSAPGDFDLGLECAEARVLLPRHLDGELEDEHASHLRGHLLACPACRAHFQDQRSLKRWFVPSAPPAVPSGFSARVAALAVVGAVMVPSAVGATTAPTEIPRLLAFTTGLVAAAAAALLALSLALAIDSRPAAPAGLRADPLPEALQRLDELNRAEDAARREAQRRVDGAAVGALPAPTQGSLR